MRQTNPHIAIVGAGLVGSLLSIFLVRRGFRVSVFEKREDLRIRETDEGRSINLALSTRGLRALDKAGLTTRIRELALPMHGRMMHDPAGKLSFLPYGKKGQFINSVSRSRLNRLLIDQAENEGARFHFGYRCVQHDPVKTTLTFQKTEGQEHLTADIVVAADGAFSAVRSALQVTERYNYSQHYLEHGYKELTIPASPGRGFVFENNALHIWPRESFMMIALPNPDESFTCTLFLPFEGSQSFASLSDEKRVLHFMTEQFPDAVPHMPNMLDEFRKHPTGSLVTIRCFPWVLNHTLLIGDAAHAIVPFYGQGMNAGFEDCRILDELLEESHNNWQVVMNDFQKERKEDADAIADLAFGNFVEMRDLVADPAFLLRKKIEARLHELYPDKWKPLYSMVTFKDEIRYSQALRLGKMQEQIMNDVMAIPDIEQRWQDLDFRQIVERMG